MNMRSLERDIMKNNNKPSNIDILLHGLGNFGAPTSAFNFTEKYKEFKENKDKLPPQRLRKDVTNT